MRVLALYRFIAEKVAAVENCRKQNNNEWLRRHYDDIDHLTREFMPSGSGIDNGTTFSLSASNPERLVFDTSFHHMDSVGMYERWTDHTIIVVPSLVHTIKLQIKGQNHQGIKDYLHDVYYEALLTQIEHDPQTLYRRHVPPEYTYP